MEYLRQPTRSQSITRAVAAATAITLGGCAASEHRSIMLDGKSVCRIHPGSPPADQVQFPPGLNVTIVGAVSREGQWISARVAKPSEDPAFDLYSLERIARSDCRGVAQMDGVIS